MEMIQLFTKREVMPMRPTSECEQANVVYDALARMNPSAEEIRNLRDEALRQCSQALADGDEEKEERCEFFVRQLFFHVQRRNKNGRR